MFKKIHNIVGKVLGKEIRFKKEFKKFMWSWSKNSTWAELLYSTQIEYIAKKPTS
jgi:hypothetical protein